MSPDPGDTLVHHIVDEILLTNDADFEQLDYEIAATLRGLSYNKLMEILKSPSEISALKYSDPNGNEITISADVKNRLQAFVPFANACQNSFGVPSLDGKVDLLTKNRIHFDGYIEYEYNPKKPTVYDPKLARESSDKRTKVVVPLNNYTANVNAPPSYPISNRPVPSKSDQLVNTFEKGRRNLENYPVMKHDDEYDNWNRLGPDPGYTTDYDYGRDTNGIMDDVREAYRSQSRNRNYARGDDVRKSSQQEGSERCRIANEFFRTLSPQDKTLFSSISNEGTAIISNYFKKLALQHLPKQPIAGTVPGHNAPSSKTTGNDEDDEEDSDARECTASRPGIGSRTVKTHRISTAFFSPFDTESLPRDSVFEANNATMDLEPTNPVRFLSQATPRDETSEIPPKPPDLVERVDSVSSADQDDSFFDGEGSFKLVRPKKKKKKKGTKEKKSNGKLDVPSAPHEVPSAADDSRVANAFEIMKYHWDDSASETDSRQVNMTKRSYSVNSSERRSQETPMTDSMITGADVRPITLINGEQSLQENGKDYIAKKIGEQLLQDNGEHATTIEKQSQKEIGEQLLQ